MSSKELIIAACEKGDLPQLKHVLEETELDVGSEPLGSEGETALHVACAHGHLDTVQYLVNDRGCSVAVPNSQRDIPLEVAWVNRHWEVVEFLLNAIQGKELFAEVGLAPTTVTQLQEVAWYGDEALHQACSHGYLEAVRFLICSDYLHLNNERGRDPTAVSSHGTTPLQVAWENKHWEVASYLLQVMRECPSCLIPNAITQLLEVVAFKEDAFHVACSRGDMEVVWYLRESLKCKVTQCNSKGLTPLDIACSNGQLQVIYFLLESGECSAPDMTELQIACLGRDEEKVRNLASDVTSLSTPDQYGITAVHYATYQPDNLSILVSIAEQKDMLSILVREDGRGNTPLHYAASCGRIKSVTRLLSHHKSVNMQNSDGETPLHLSLKSNYSDSNLVRQIILHESCQENSLVRELRWCTAKFKKKAKVFLHQAVASGRLGLVQALLNIPGYNINQFNSDGETPLHIACRSDFETFKLLATNSRCDLNAQNKNGLTALHLSIATGWLNKCELLLTNMKCNPNIFHSDESMPLHMLVVKKYYRILCTLLENPKCDSNIINKNGDSALHLATRKCLVECATYLLQHDKTDPNIQNTFGNTSLHEVVIARAPIEIMESLTQHRNINPNLKNSEGNSTLHLAVREHSLRHTTCLLKHERINPNIQNHIGNTPLHEVIITGTAIMKSLIQHKSINPNMKNNEGNTALHLAVREHSLRRTTCLLQHERIDPNIQNRNGNTPLHEVVMTRAPMESLIQHNNINPNMKNNEGDSALHLAVKNHSLHYVKCLLQHEETDPNIQNEIGNTPLHEAVITRAPNEIMKLMIQHARCIPCINNGYGNTPWQIASKNGLPQYFITFIGHGKYTKEEVRDAACGFHYLLHQTVLKNDTDLLQMLLSILQCDVNETNQDGETALHIACSKCSIDVVQVLVADKRCDLNVQNNTGETALHIAVYSKFHGTQKVQSILYGDKCNPNVANNEGHTPLHVAVRGRKFRMAAILLTHSKVEPNAQDNNGNTPLHIAVSEVSLPNFKPFLSHESIDLNIQNMQGNTPLHEAIIKETLINVVHALIFHKNCNPSQPNYRGITPLQLSLHFGRMDYVEVLVISRKCSHDDIVKATKGTLLLHKAVSSNRRKLALRLLDVQEYNMNETNFAGETALHIACIPGCSKVILEKLVEDSRCDLNAQDQHGNTALHLAVYSGTDVTDKAQCILQSERCNPNITNSEGYTPLHVAVKKRDFETTVSLLRHSQCNPNIQDLTGNTPLHIAIGEILLSGVECFLNHKNIDLFIQNREGNTPLHEAVVRQVPVNIVKALTLHNSCNPSIANNAGMTPLQISVTFGELDYAEVLITSGKCSHEDIVKATEGTLLLHQAVTSNRHEPLLLGLIAVQECNVNVTNSSGETVFHIACSTKYSTALLQKLVKTADVISMLKTKVVIRLYTLLYIVHQKLLRKYSAYYRVRGVILISLIKRDTHHCMLPSLESNMKLLCIY